MRLTLRTMLAYLDDILEPKDASELGDKIQESSFASDLVHRIRTSTRRLRLGAPKLSGEGMGLDPNTVAEYLDNTLPSDHVPDFEKVCLESDVHLAEVASCHQVLTIVLGEPAEIDQPLRERMYRIGHDAVGEAATEDHVAVAPPPMPKPVDSTNGSGTPVTPPGRPAQPTVSRAAAPPAVGVSMKSLAITLLCTFVVAVVALRAVGPFDHTHVAYRALFGSRTPHQVADNDGNQPPTEESRPQPVEERTPSGDGTASGDGTPSEGSASVVPSAPVEPAPSDIPATKPPAAPTGETPDSPPDSIPATVIPGPTTLPPGPATVTPVPSETGAGEVTPPVPATVTPESVSPESLTPDTGAAPTVPAAPTVVPVPGTSGDSPPGAAARVVDVGRYVAEDQLLARFDPSMDDWYQTPTGSVLKAGDQLIAFPTYRPHAVIGDISITLVNETSVELLAPGDEGQPRINFHFGSAVILPFKAAAGRIALKIGDQEGHVVFGDLDSVAAVQVSRYLPPGTDPEKAVAKHIFRLYAVSGRVGWSELGAKTVVVDAGRMLARVDGGAPSVVDAGAQPTWIEGRDQKEIERRASLELRSALEKDRPLSRSLMEMTDFRQHEVVDLACRSLSYLGVYDPLVKALGDKRQHYYWSDQFDELRAIGSRSPESAAALRRMIEKLHAGDAAALHRLTWGYSPAQLSSGGDAELVDYLEDDSMAIRVLAFMNLERITGGVTKNFRPELPPSQEKTKVANWRRALKEGTVVYKTPPTPWAPPAEATPSR